MNDVTRILIVEDQSSDYELAQREIRKAIPNCQFQRVEREAEFLEALREFQPDVILSDYKLPQFNGMRVLELVQQSPSSTPVIIWTGAMSEDVAVECMKQGASNYVLKENIKRLGPAASHVLKEREEILERKQAEKKFRDIFENSPVGIFQSSPQGRFIRVNAAMARIYGYASPQEMIDSITDIASQIYIEAQDRNQFTQLLQTNASVENFEMKNIRKDGSFFWTSTSARAVGDETGTILYYEGFLQDITDRKLAESKLLQSEARYRGIFDNVQDAIFVESLEGDILEVNQRACEIFGYTRQEFLQKKVTDIVPSQGYIMNSPDANLFPGQAIETVNVRANGEQFPVEISGGLYEFGERSLFLIILRDITERKEAERQLRMQEERFRALIENGMDNISLLAREGTLLWENPAVNSTLGYKYDEFVDHNIFELMHPDDKAWTRELFAKVVEEPGNQQNGTFRLRHHNGTWRWMEATATNMLEQPSVNAIVINYRDVTERKIAEEELRKSQRQYQSLVETSHDLIWAVDAEGKITFINHAAKDIYGDESEELIGRSFFELLAPQAEFDRTDFKEMIGSANEYHAVESHVRHKDGRQFILSANSIVLRDEQGNVTGVTGTSRDITKRKQAEDALQEERNLLRTLIDNLPDRIYAMDRQGRKTLSNSADWKASGKKTMEEVIGKTDFDLYPPELAKPFWESNKTVIDSGQPLINFEEPGLDFHGNRVSVLTTKIPLRDEEGNVIGLVGVGRDITERKQAEAKINDLLSLNEKMLNYSPLGVLTYKLSGECVFANEKAAFIIGTNVENLMLQNFHSIEAWKKSGLYSLVQEAIATKTVTSGDFHHETSFGKNVWLTAHCGTFTSNNEEHVLLSILDITERKRAEEKLLRSQQELTEAQRVAKIGSWSFDPIQNRVHWSDELYRIFGIGQENFSHTYDGFLALIHPDDRLKVQQKNNDSLKGGASFEAEYRFMTSAGEVKTISELGYAVTAEDGQVASLFGTAQDITERKRAELERQALFEIMQGLAITNDLQEFLKLIHTTIAKVIYAENFFVVLHHPDTGLFEEIYSVDEYDPPAPPSRLEKSITSHVFHLGEPLLLKEKEFDELFSQGKVELVGAPSASWLGAPLKTSAGTIGVIAVQDYQDPNRYSEHDKDFLASIAAQVALAVERKQAEGALEKSTAQLRTLFEASPDAIMLIDPHNNWTIVDCNSAACKINGYTREELIGRPVDILNTELSTVESNREYFKRIQDTDVLRYETEHVHKNGTVFPIEVSTSLIRLGERVMVLGIDRDITERKRAEQKLRDSEERYRLLFENSGEAILITQTDGTILSANPEACRMFGRSEEEIQKLGRTGIVDSSDPRLPLAIEERNKTGQFKGELGLLRKDGSRFPAEVSTAIFMDSSGNPKTSMTIRDITERRRSEVAEREQRVLAEALRDTSQMLSSSLDYGEVLDHILTAVGQVVPHDAATIMLIDNGFAHVVRSQGYEKRASNEEITGVRLALAETTNLRTMLETKQPVIVYDTYEYSGWKRMEATDWLRSSVGAPISTAGKVIGFVMLDSEAPGFFTPAHAEHLEAFANQAAVAIHNAELLQQAQNEIAERKRVEEELRQSENRYRTVVENQTEFIVRWKPDGTRTFVNDAYCRYYGITVEHALSTGFIPLIHEDDRQMVEEKISRLLSGMRMIETDVHRVIKQDGSIGWNEWTDQAIYNENGQLVEFQAVGRDITERKRAEEELRASEERFRQLADNIEEVFWMTDAQTGRELYISPAGEKIWGRSLEHLFNDPNAFIQTIAVEDQPSVLRALEREKNGERVEIEYRVTQSDGSVHWVWDRAFPIFDENGKVKTLAGIAADVTKRRQAEDALRESEARFSNALEYAPIGIALVGLDGMWLKVNQALCELLGYAEHEMMSKTFQEITHPDDLNMDLQFVEETLAGKIVSYQLEKRYIHKSGKIVWALLSVSLVRDQKGKPQYFVSQIQDITERKRSEKETSALLETSLALTNLDLKSILQTVGNSAKSLFAADGCRIFLMQPDGESLSCVLALQENAAAFLNLKIRLGEGVTGTVAASGKAEIINDMLNDPRGIQVQGTDEEKEAIMFAPLKERDHTIGVLSIRRAGAERPFQPADLELLEAFASMAASAVSNARLFEEAQQRLDELEAIYENGLAVSQLLEPREIGHRIIETFAHYLSWHHVTIRLLRSETDELEVIAFNLPGLNEDRKIEMEHHFNQMVSKTGQGLSGWVMQTGTPIRTGNVQVNPRYVDTQAGIHSGLYMPLKVADRIVGVISVESKSPDAFTEQDERLLATLASQAAVAFENARLYQAAHQELLERTRAQAALWASETHYRELADSITDILFELDYNLVCTHWNKASEMFSGIPAEDAIGKTIKEVWGESTDQLKREEIYKSVLSERQARTFEVDVLAKDRKQFLEIHAYPSTRGVSVVARDITERKLTEKLMEKRFGLIEYSSQHSTSEVLQKVIDEVSELTDSHIGFMHFVEEDETTITLEAWSTETLRDFCQVEGGKMHPSADRAGVWADAIREHRSLIHNDYESLPNRKGLPEGHAQVIREIMIPIIRGEKVVAVMGMGNKPKDYTQHDIEIVERFADYAWDIIERRQMEAALADERNQLARRVEERTADLSRANSNLARALRVKDEFLANMSHELRTPLNAILGLSESLSEQVAGPLNEKQQKYLSTINESGHHLLSLINDILDLAKIEAGQITLDINKVDVNSVCQASLRMIKQLAQKKNQEVLFDIDSDVGLMWADERRLKQMIVNLLSNAVKFTPESGQLGLEVRGDEAGNRMLITVWDKGIGIGNQDLERLFKPFVQLDSGLAREATGTGLGLALVAQMARLHGGSVSVESQVGEGSRFTILLPWEPALAVDASTRLRNTGKFRAIDPNAANKPTVLLIEDTREVVMMLVDYLEMSGFKMITAQDGTDGIQQAKLFHPNLILMDVMMPGMDGFETTRRLRQDPQFKDTPIIALTALAMPSDRQRCLDAGMDEYISKPVNLKALVKLIQSILLEKEDTKPK